MNEIIERLKAESPLIFKRILYFGITMGAFGGSVLAAKHQLPLWLVNIADDLIQIGIIAGIVASLTRKDPPKEA